MKKIILAITMIPLFLVPALLAQGKPITEYDPATEKIKISGFVLCHPGNLIETTVKLSYKGRPVAHARVWLNTWELLTDEDGLYHGKFSPYEARLGKIVEIAVEFPSRALVSITRPPFEGRQVLATYRIENIIEWVFPIPGIEIDLAAYPVGLIPFRWNFTGTTITANLRIFPDTTGSTQLYSVRTSTEETNMPASITTPGNAYYASLSTAYTSCGDLGVFKLSKYAAPDPSGFSGGRIVFDMISECHFTTKASK